MRVTSQIWADALMRTVYSSGCYGGVVRRGATEAGAIFVIVNHLDGQFSLFGPAPQILVADAKHSDRLFVELISKKSEQEVTEKMADETKFDYDLWIIEIEDKQDHSFLEIAKE